MHLKVSPYSIFTFFYLYIFRCIYIAFLIFLQCTLECVNSSLTHVIWKGTLVLKTRSGREIISETLELVVQHVTFYILLLVLIGTFNSLTTKKQTTKFSSANFQKMLSPSYVILRIQRLEGKQCRSRGQAV